VKNITTRRASRSPQRIMIQLAINSSRALIAKRAPKHDWKH